MEKKIQKNTYNLNSRFMIHNFAIQDHINEIDISNFMDVIFVIFEKNKCKSM